MRASELEAKIGKRGDMNHKMSERPQETRLDFGSDEILAQSNAKQVGGEDPRSEPLLSSGLLGLLSLCREETQRESNSAFLR